MALGVYGLVGRVAQKAAEKEFKSVHVSVTTLLLGMAGRHVQEVNVKKQRTAIPLSAPNLVRPTAVP